MTGLLLQVVPPSPTWFTDSPEWGWYIVVYFFLGGIAGGAAFLSGLLDLLGDRLDRRMTRIGYLIALVAIIIGGPILIIDLTRPERFWHMVWMSDTGGPMFKPYSAISLGIWIIMAFVIFVVLAVIASFAGQSGGGSRPVMTAYRLTDYRLTDCLRQDRRPRLRPHRLGAGGVHRSRPDRHQPAALGDTVWITLLFLLSGISAGARR